MLITKKERLEVEIPTEIFSRISGYFRPVMQWNRGKKEEYKERKMMDVEKALRR